MRKAERKDEPDLADTVIGAILRVPLVDVEPDDDTIVPGSSAQPFDLVEPAEPSLRADASGAEVARVNPVVATQWDPEVEPASPKIHAIRIATHEPIPLNIPALIGRRPCAPRISNGQHANLIRVPSPTREISSTHVQIRQEGSAVVVTDLDSTNGTIVTMPGFPLRKLRQGESAVVIPGTVIELGDGMSIEILPLPEATE